MTTNYHRTFITVSPDSTAEAGRVPPREGSIAQLQYALLAAQPYQLTSDDLLFAVHARRRAIPESEWAEARGAFFSKPQACLRASPLVKQFGWGLHHDAAGRVALHGIETERYRALSADPDITCLRGMRSKR